MRTAGQVARAIVNTPNCILSLDLQQKLVDISDEENKAIWAECIRSCNSADNNLLLAQMKQAKLSTLFR